ncbi:UDP-N-acetylmuramate dehydrogenase [Noviherbaspirillum humi]|uniref:UDP-N-acetylenolpyruvoylglucosamine reductase n=1 Tax=Noviherbaspirillum humi TaxID=1688639 RepID=A0A239GLW0_9BURK|nr:UDP-N-acetylmuramate dehydrogenase [Noviherbaspirillum humi]SNS69875.1 UDP-N-acetylmuramate dehydrogenase [Noviherbaspirillum humi]
MISPLPLRRDHPLDKLNTFGIAARAHAFLPVASADTLRRVREADELARLPRLVLGGGSNLLLTRDFPGLVLHMCGKGIELLGSDDTATYVRAAAGESWHGFTQQTLALGLPGLENLSLIPGSVGAAPIQNIGAYGMEIKDRFHELTAFDMETGRVFTLNREACRFGYRDSVFKHGLGEHAVILDVTFALPKQWQPNTRYADVTQELEARGIAEPSARDVSDAIIAIRSRKLPDPARIGNAGSFFKNPVVAAEVRHALAERHPQLVSYVQPDGSFKLAAGWLIDQCGWKGRKMGRAGVYERQALVLVNHGGASGAEVEALARAIQDDVRERFGVMLEPEPVFV